MRWLVLPLAVLALSACHERGEASKKLDDAKYRATLENRGIGRFQIVPGSGNYPPLFLDTVTGCVDQFHINTNTGALQKLPVDAGDHACLGDMPRDQEREIMETLKK